MAILITVLQATCVVFTVWVGLGVVFLLMFLGLLVDEKYFHEVSNPFWIVMLFPVWVPRLTPKWIKRQWMWLTHLKVDRNSDFFKVLNEFKKDSSATKEKVTLYAEEIDTAGLYKRIYPSSVLPCHGGVIHLISSKPIYKGMYSGDGHYRDGVWNIWHSGERCYITCETTPEYWMDDIFLEKPVKLK